MQQNTLLLRAFSSTSCLILFASACSAGAAPSYRGEPLAEISGTVIGDASRLSSIPEAAILWVGEYTVNVAGVGAESVAAVQTPIAAETNSAFPNRFTMKVYTPPPDAAFFRISPIHPLVARVIANEPLVAIGFIVALNPPSTARSAAGGPWNTLEARIAAGTPDYFVAYAAGTIRAGSPWAKAFGEPFPAGYNLFHLRPRAAQEAQAVQDCENTYETGFDIGKFQCEAFPKHAELVAQALAKQITLTVLPASPPADWAARRPLSEMVLPDLNL